MFKSQVTAWKRLLLLLLLTGASLISQAQVYPVQLSTLVAPPYSIYLPDYASPGGEKLRLVLLQRDLTVQGYRLRFEMKVQVNGITIMQTSRSAVPPPITLQPGIPTVLGGSDLSWYVQPQNLEFGGGYSSSTYEQSRSLPEGPITITFTAYDYTRSDVQVSATASSFFYATRDNPPLLNYPACGMQVTAINPQFLNFSWLPQNTSSPNSALQTNYIFSIYAVLPAGYNFQDIVQSTRPVYSVTTQLPNLVYGPGEPPLVPGQSYAWRVQAVDASGRDIFRNNGYSETCNFIYSGDSSQGIVNYPPIQISAASAGPAQGRVSWAMVGSAPGITGSGGGLAASGYDGYRLYYRKAQGDYDWFSVDVNDSMYRVFDLEPSTAYEARLQGHKNGSYGPYTDIANFTTDAAKAVGCTDNTSMLGTPSGRPLAVATGGMNITYGPWDVQLLTVQALSSPGQFKGTCKVTVPFMGAMTFNAKFDNLTIDDSRNVTAGNIVFLSQGLQAWIDSSIRNQMGGAMYGSVVSGTDTTNVTVRASLANLDHLDVIDSSNGDIKSFTIPGNPPVVVAVNDGMQELTIKDSSGNTYALDNQGNLTQLSLSDGSLQNFFADAGNVAGLNTLASGVGTVTFTDADSKYAFDAWKPFYAQASTILTSQYEKLSGGSGDYHVPQKAIGAGESDIVGLNIDLPDNMDEDSLVFATGKGTKLIWDPKDYTLNLIGGPAADAQEVYALYPKPGGGYYSLGKLLVSAYEHQDFTAVLVPVVAGDGAAPKVDRQRYEDSLNSIYNKINISWTVEQAATYTNTGWDADRNGLLTMSGSSFLSNSLTGEPAALIKAYRNAVPADNTKKYVFILNTSSGSTGEIGGLQGDMPRATQYGFLFLQANADVNADPAVTLAHELGHGQFNLEHTFSGDIALGGQGATSTYPNLMDYLGSNYRHLYKYQWNQAHQPGQVMGIFESDEAGQCVLDNIYSQFVVDTARIPDGGVIYTPDLKQYKVKGVLVSPVIEVNGTLSRFTYEGRTYISTYKVVGPNNQMTGTFTGYVDQDKVKALGKGPWNTSDIVKNGCLFDPAAAGWQLVTKNSDVVDMMKGFFAAHQGYFQNDNPQIRADILALVQQLPGKVFTINKDDSYVFLLDLQKLKERLQGILNVLTAGNQQLADLIKAYKAVKGTRVAKDLQLVIDETDPINQARCNISKLLNDQWHVHLINSGVSDPEFANFQTLTSDQRIDLLNIYYDAPELTSSAWGVTGYNCSLSFYGEQIVDAVLSYSTDLDKYSILNLFKQNPDMLRRFYLQIDNKSILINDNNFDVFIHELIKLSAVANQNVKKASLVSSNPVIVWSDSLRFELVKYVSFTDDAKLQLSYVTYAPGVGTALVFFLPAAALADMKINTSPAVDPMQIVNLVIPKPSSYFPDLPQDPNQYPYTLQLPAISVAWMVNKSTNDRIQLGVDLALIALPVGDLFEAGNGLVYLWRVAKIAVPAVDVLLKTEEGNRVLYKLYGVYDSGISDDERQARTQKANNFSDQYTKFSNLVNIGAMGEGMYTMYTSLRGSVYDMRSAHAVSYTAGEQQVMGQIENDMNSFDAALPDNLKKGELTAVAVSAGDNQLFNDIESVLGKNAGGARAAMDVRGNVVAEILDNGSLQLDAVGTLEDITAGSKVLKMEEGQTFVVRGSPTSFTEDLMIVQQSDQSVICVRGACFAAGTRVLTANGLKKIEEIRAGEAVESFDEVTRTSGLHKVVRIMQRTAGRMVILSAGSSVIRCTPEHPVYANHQWTAAGKLHIGDTLFTANGTVLLQGREEKDTVAVVYNLEVEGAHSYYVGEDKICVHNDCAYFQAVEKQLNDPTLYKEFHATYSDAANAPVLALFKKGTLSLNSWKCLRPYTDLVKDATILAQVEALIRQGHIAVDDLAAIITANRQLGGAAAAISDLLPDLANLSNYTNCPGYGTLISNLQKADFGSADGANWIISALRKYPKQFKPANISFEVADGIVRRYDVVTTTGTRTIYYEFKSYSSLPPADFGTQFLNDLKNLNVNDLTSDIKWWFDSEKLTAAKISADDFRTQMKAALQNLDYDDATIRKFVRGINNPGRQDLINLINANFDNIFLIK